MKRKNMDHDWFRPIDFSDLYNKSVSSYQVMLNASYGQIKIPLPWVPGDSISGAGDFQHFNDFIENDLDIDFTAFDTIDENESLPDVFSEL